MPFPSIRVLAAAVLALSATGAAQAFNGSSGGNYGGSIYYQHFIQVSQNPAQWGSIPGQYGPTHSTYQGCVDQMNTHLAWLTAPQQNTSASYYHVATVVPCRYRPGWGSLGEVQFGLSSDLLIDFANGERVLRERYRLDQYEAELGALYKRLQPVR